MNGFEDPIAHWNERFGGDAFHFGTEPCVVLAEQAALFSPGDRVLAVADGEGRNAAWLAGRGCDVVAFDASPVGVDKARRLARERGVGTRIDFRVARVEAWDWTAQAFDAVVAVFVQFAPPSLRDAMFRGFAAALRPGGRLVLVGYGLAQLEYRTGGPGRAEHLYTEAMLRDAFAGWEIERLHRADRELAEGVGHHGRSDVVELIASRPAPADRR